MADATAAKIKLLSVILTLVLSIFGQVYAYGRLYERVDGLHSDVTLIKTILLQNSQRAGK